MVKSSSPSFDVKFMCSRESKRFLLKPRSMSCIQTTGLALSKAHPVVPHHLNAAVAMILIIIVAITTTPTSTISPFLAAIAASFISSYSSSLFHMRFSVAGNFPLIARLLVIRKQMRFSTIKAPGSMFDLPCSMMATGNVPGVGGI